MARVAGRNRVIAVPVGLACLAIVGALVWFGLPAFSTIGTWFASGAPTLNEASASPSPSAVSGPVGDCREVYPDAVWGQLALLPDAKLTQDVSSARTGVPAAVKAAQPQIQVSCSWSVGDSGQVATTVAQIDPDNAALIESSLRGQNFHCLNDDGDGIRHCTRTQGDTVEDHTLRGQRWVWHYISGDAPDGYVDGVTERILQHAE